MTPETNLGPNAIVGSYRIVRPLGRGGMGMVYEAQHTMLSRRAAIKVMHAELRRHPGMASRMVQEAVILDDLHHAGVVRVYECGLLADHRPWIAMELVEGESLSNRLSYGGTLDAVEVATLLAAVAETLEPVHQRGIVHRDLKPDNILMTPDDARFPLRVIDWGIARLGPHSRLTIDGASPGTPMYMSPEQVCGHAITPACDIYALGVIAYEALTGQPPFDGHSLAEVVCLHVSGSVTPLSARCATAPAELCALVHRMLAKAPAARPSATEVRGIAQAITAIPLQVEDNDDTIVVDTEFFDGDTLPVVEKIRWTPEIATAQQGHHLIVPRGPFNQVAGEIIAKPRR